MDNLVARERNLGEQTLYLTSESLLERQPGPQKSNVPRMTSRFGLREHFSEGDRWPDGLGL